MFNLIDKTILWIIEKNWRFQLFIGLILAVCIFIAANTRVGE